MILKSKLRFYQYLREKYHLNIKAFQIIHDYQKIYTIGFPEPNRIVSLGGAHIFTGKGEKCIFTGTIYYKLISGNSFYYSFYGDVYKTATTTVGGGVTVGIGENSSINFNASCTSNYLMYVSRSETYKSAAMRP